MLRRTLLLLLAGALFVLPSTVLGQSKDSRFSIGVGVVSAPRPYEGVDSETIVIPVLLYQKGGFYFRGVQVGYEWFRDKPFFFEVFGRPRFDGYEEDDGDILEDMDDRDPSIDAGIAGGWRQDHIELRLGVEADVSGASDGMRIEASAAFPWKTEKWRFKPSLSVWWLDDDVVDYYYGVERSEASPALRRRAYEGDSTMNLELAFLAIYQAGEKWAFYGRVYGQTLGDEIENSPLVDDGAVGGAMLGFLYTF